LAWQLCGAEAFDMIAENDANGIAPGSHVLETIFKKYTPCLILIDEWVAYLWGLVSPHPPVTGRSR
jgi:uncharacterized protein